jgi:acyl-coenzyme A thioesterase PaaI-like protein
MTATFISPLRRRPITCTCRLIQRLRTIIKAKVKAKARNWGRSDMVVSVGKWVGK